MNKLDKLIFFLIALLIAGIIAIFMSLKGYDFLAIFGTFLGVLGVEIAAIQFFGEELIDWLNKKDSYQKLKNSILEIRNGIVKLYQKIKASILKMRDGIVNLYQKIKDFNFKTWICTRICPPPVLPEVFVHARGKEDMEQAKKIIAFLEKNRINCIPPLDTKKSPTEMRHDLEQNLLCSQAVIIVFEHNSDLEWFKHQVSKCKGIKSKLDKPLTVAIYTQKNLSSIDLPTNYIILSYPCNNPNFKSFIKKLKAI